MFSLAVTPTPTTLLSEIRDREDTNHLVSHIMYPPPETTVNIQCFIQKAIFSQNQKQLFNPWRLNDI